jgi:hypothetical protein
MQVYNLHKNILNGFMTVSFSDFTCPVRCLLVFSGVRVAKVEDLDQERDTCLGWREPRNA